MNIHVISVAYGLATDLMVMWRAVMQSEYELHWHLFRHSNIPDVVNVCDILGVWDNVSYYPYGVNRGLAKSINEGLLAAFGAGADLVVNIADDMLPQTNDFDKLVDFAMQHRDMPMVTATANHLRDNRRGSCELSFTAFNPVFLDTVGMLDENYFPAYYEDTDTLRRAQLMGYDIPVCERTKIIHASSKNIHNYPELMEQNHRTFRANRAYYIKKWGGDKGEEVHEYPFGDKSLPLKINPRDRDNPYPRYKRMDFEQLVKI